MDTQTCSDAHDQGDWHPADVKAALEKRGLSLRKLAEAHGFSHFQRVLVSPWWSAEQIVASALGVEPSHIWPSRYRLPRTRAQQQTTKITLTRTGKIRVTGRPA